MTRFTSLAFAALLVGGGVAAFATGSNTNFTVNTTIKGNGQNDGTNDINLNYIKFSQNEIYNAFIGPSAVTKLVTSNNHVNNGLRVTAGKNTTVGDKIMVLDDNDGKLEGQEVTNAVFRNQLKDAFNSRNINWFFDSWVTDTGFCLDVKYGAALKDKVFLSERGSGGSNSKFTLQGLDSNGNLIGNAVKVDPSRRVNTGLNGVVYEQGKNPSVLDWHQEISFYAFDVKDFGVGSLAGIRVTTPNASLGSGQDIQPDFKLYGSAAPVPEPGTMIALGAGAAFFGLRRRRKA